MGLFSNLINKVSHWAKHPHAPYYLAGLSFAESSVFPIPPDVMLISMAASAPQKAWRFAGLTALFSVMGGMLGYCLGEYFFHIIEPYISQLGYGAAYQQVQSWFMAWGFWIIIFAGFIPIPYKLFTIGAGAAHMIFFPFVLASIISRSVRFFLVTAVVQYGGQQLYSYFYRYIEYIGWTIMSIVVVAGLIHILH